MARAERTIEQDMKLVDGVCEMLDARIPYASRNPDIDRLAAGRPRLLILNRADLADEAITKRWQAHFAAQGLESLATDARTGRGLKAFAPTLRRVLSSVTEANAARGQSGRVLRLMILGIPNVGKSTLINQVAGRRAAVVADRPGVTRGRQWITIDDTLELLDTPGILWPRLGSQAVGEALAITGAIRSEVLDEEALAVSFLRTLSQLAPDVLQTRYGLDLAAQRLKFQYDPDTAIVGQDAETAFGYILLEELAKLRSMRLPGGEADTMRAARALLSDFRSGKLGRISLETPESYT